MSLPPFVCALQCKNQPTTLYLGRLLGCASGLHITPYEIDKLPATLYNRMANVIYDEDFQGRPQQQAPDPCSVCHVSVLPRPPFPVLYLENCAHCYHHDCLHDFSRPVTCRQCRVVSSRVLLWPELLPTAVAKNEIFQLQKRSFGIDVAPPTALEVSVSHVIQDFPTIWLTLNKKVLTVCKRSAGAQDVCKRKPVLLPLEPCSSQVIYNKKSSRKSSQSTVKRSHCHCGPEMVRQRDILATFRCPNGDRCQLGPKVCGLWHDGRIQGGQLREFPEFVCLRNSRIGRTGPRCVERLRVHSRDVARCLFGFHVSVQDLNVMDGFGQEMFEEIKAPVAEPNQVCAFCEQQVSDPANPVVMHMQNCSHWLHVSCHPLARARHLTNTGRTLDMLCPTCAKPSVRTLAWPGPFRSEMLKQTIFGRQLGNFMLDVRDDTKLAIVEVADRVNVFTLDYGGQSLVTIDFATAEDIIYVD